MRVVVRIHLVRRGNTFHFCIAAPRELVARGRVLGRAIEALFAEVRRMPELTRQHVEWS